MRIPTLPLVFVGAMLAALPLLALCGATILSLRSDQTHAQI